MFLEKVKVALQLIEHFTMKKEGSTATPFLTCVLDGSGQLSLLAGIQLPVSSVYKTVGAIAERAISLPS
jgi:hypothetical protein